MPTRRQFLAASTAALTAGAARAADPKPLRVLLRSSWQTINIGDIAHTPGMVALLTELVPGVELTLWPGNIGDGVKEMLARVPSWRWRSRSTLVFSSASNSSSSAIRSGWCSSPDSSTRA